jgi:hypothetical protein
MSLPGGTFTRIECLENPTRLPVNARFVSVTISDGRDGCGLTSDGVVYCFGDAAIARLPTTQRFRAIFTASNQPCAIRTDGVAFCWTTDIRTSPMQISGDAWNTIALRGTCGITADSAAACWQVSSSGVTLKTVLLPYHWTHIDVAATSACALASTGELACWNPFSSTMTQSLTVVPDAPTLVFIGNMRTSRAQDTQTCGLTAGGDMYCWVADRSTSPATFSLLPFDLGVKLRSFSSDCGIGVDGKAYCWTWSSLKALLVPGQE